MELTKAARSVREAREITRAMAVLGIRVVSIDAYGTWTDGGKDLIFGPFRVSRLGPRDHVTADVDGETMRVRPHLGPAHEDRDKPKLEIRGRLDR